MPLVRDIEGKTVAGAHGKPIGMVEHVLFHAAEPRVVGLEVRPRPWLLVIPRPMAYVPLERVTGWGANAVWLDSKRLPGRGAGPRLGLDWDTTVVWRGMPVRTRSGEPAGAVGDAGFTKRSGSLTRLLISEGFVTDKTFGAKVIDSEFVEGFDGTAIVVDDAVLAVESTGGAAKAAGEAAGAARTATRGAVVKVAAGGMAAAKMVAGSKTGRAAGKAAGRAWRGLRTVVADALGPEQDEE